MKPTESDSRASAEVTLGLSNTPSRSSERSCGSSWAATETAGSSRML